jgi:hypothetical protein
MNYGNSGERPATDKNIADLPLPKTGPLYGKGDPLLTIWGRSMKSDSQYNERRVGP